MARGRPPKNKATPNTKSSEEEDVEMLEDEDGEETGGNVGDDKKMDVDDTTVPPLPVSTQSDRKVIVTNKGVVDIGWEHIVQVTLNHPSTERKSLFLIDVRLPSPEEEFVSTAPFIFEVMTMEGETRSWFIGDSVISNGNLYMCTQIDPLFLVLPSMMKTTRAMPLKDHLMETIKDSKVIDVISARLLATGQLGHISEKIVCDDIIAYKFLEDKTLEWLTRKAKKAAEWLKQKEITGSEASVSSNFSKSSSATSPEKMEEEYLRYSCEIVGEYLPEILKMKLFESLGVPYVQEKVSKRKSELDGSDADPSNTKKLKVADVNRGTGASTQPTEDYGTSTPSNSNPVSSKVTAKDKELQKAAKGTQSLFKFFAAKPK